MSTSLGLYHSLKRIVKKEGGRIRDGRVVYRSVWVEVSLES